MWYFSTMARINRGRACARVACLASALALVTGCGDASSVAESEAQNLTDTPEPEGDIGEADELWVVMQSHLHTTGQHDCANNPLDPGPLPEGECYSAEGIEGFVDAALDYGASDMIITDHNNVDAWFDPAFRPKASADGSHYATPLRGAEWSSGEGHMTLFYPRQVVDTNQEAFDRGLLWAAGNHSHDPSAAEYHSAVDHTHDAGGLVVINHPQLMIHPFDDATYGADAVEVGVKLKPVLQSTSATRMWWHERLVERDRITAMAGSDHHHGGGDLPLIDEPIFGVAVNLIRIDPTLPNIEDALEATQTPQLTIDRRSDIVADAIRRGHVMVVEDLHTPRVYIGADVDGDGRFHDARGGDCVPTAYEGETLPIRIRVTQAALEGIGGHYNLKVYTEDDGNSTWFYTEIDPEMGFEAGKDYRVDESDPFAIELEVPVSDTTPGFIRVEIEKDQFGPYNDAKTISNPIYYGPWGSECEGSEPLL
jgi:hypothetical protein